MNKRTYLNSFFVINAFHDIECNFNLQKKIKSIILALRFFVYLLLSLTNEWPRNTL